ncbi:MAG TPA: hypothetical protein VES64_03210, partial [Allosphingosinicella sp.]|nr:hypothetical protein [Allosphingosinicella sp.]
MWRKSIGILGLLVLSAAPAKADWYRGESPNFIVYSETTRARLRDRILLLEAFDRLLRGLTATTAPPSPNKLRVYLAHGIGALQYVAPVGQNVGGFYRASPDGAIAIADEYQNWRSNEDDTLLHEYTHHFMQQYHPAPYPTWYAEGFADYLMSANITPERIEYGNYNPIRASWLVSRRGWIPYEQILFGNPRRLSAGRFYSQSWLLVHYIMANEARRAAFVRYIQAVTRGDDARAAFTASFGMGATDVDRILHEYARRITFHRITRSGTDPAPPIRIERLEQAGLDTPLIEAALTIGVRAANRRAVLNDARRAGRGDDAFGKRLQARAEILYGDVAVADRLLDELLAAAPTDAELLYLKGLRHLVAGRRDAAARRAEYRLAQGFFGRAHRADPNHYPTLFRYAEALSEGD